MLENYPREIVIKSGVPVILRPLVLEDEQRMLEFFQRIPEDERWFLRENVADPEVMYHWIRRLDFESVIPLVAVTADGTIIANVRIHRRHSDCMTHVAHLRIQVDPAYRHQRLGTWMLLDAIKLAMSMGIEKLVAEFVSGVEEPAMNAARKLDFFEQAVLRDYVKNRRGEYHDLIIMIKTIHREWSDF
ncbi:MAG: GNAT family protein [Thermodesulfobacteriota bacterium]